MFGNSDGGPAFPRPVGWNGLSHHEEHRDSDEQDGMTLRDYFAGQALMGMSSGVGCEDIADRAYALADAMIAARDKTA